MSNDCVFFLGVQQIQLPHRWLPEEQGQPGRMEQEDGGQGESAVCTGAELCRGSVCPAVLETRSAQQPHG